MPDTSYDPDTTAPDYAVNVVAYSTYRSLVSHLPEIVLRVPRKDVIVLNSNVFPEIAGLYIWFKAKRSIAFEVRDIQTVGLKAVNFC